MNLSSISLFLAYYCCPYHKWECDDDAAVACCSHVRTIWIANWYLNSFRQSITIASSVKWKKKSVKKEEIKIYIKIRERIKTEKGDN